MIKVFAPLATLSVLLFAAPASAAFQGQLDFKITMQGGAGTMKVLVGEAGVRTEMDMKARGQDIAITMVVKHADHDTAYMINDRSKTYAEVDLKKARESKQKGGKYTAKKLGKDKIAGYDATRSLVTDERGNKIEVWTTKQLELDEKMMRAMGDNAPNEGLMAALKDAGAEGFVLKLVNKDAEESLTMEVVKVEKRKIPASRFEVPAGYKKSEMGVAGAAMSPEQQKQLQEAMKNMTPEQRKQMEQALQQQGATR